MEDRTIALDAHLPAGQLTAYLLGRLADDEHQAVEQHLDECPECQERAAGATLHDSLFDLLASVTTEPRLDSFAYLPTIANTVNSQMVSTPGAISITKPFSEASRLADPVPPAALAEHPRYRVLRLLGWGGMGSVWLAEHRMMGRQVALKMIRPELLAKAGSVERFHREVQAAAQLNHPHIATAYDAEQVGDTHFLVMEFVAGQTLSERVRPGPLPLTEACRAVRDAARGLAHAHAAGLVHRDVKPGNIMQAADGTVKLLDFGLVVTQGSDSQLTDQNLVMGTPDYVAPEQAEDPRSADARSDIYSLGCTLYHLLSGRVPFPADSIVKKIDAHRELAPEPIPGLPEPVWNLLNRMMAKSPAERFPSANEVIDAIEPFCTGSHPASSMSIRNDSARPRRRAAIAWALFVTAAAVWGGAAYLRHQQAQSQTSSTSSNSTSVASTPPITTVTAPASDEHGAVRYPLLEPTKLGSGNPLDLQIDGNVLRLDTTGRSPQLWLNYEMEYAESWEIHCRFKILESTRSVSVKLSCWSPQGAEYNLHMTDDPVTGQRMLRLEKGKRKAKPPVRTLAKMSVAEDFGRELTEIVLRIRDGRVAGLIDGKTVLTAECDESALRIPCLVAAGCRIEMHAPYVLKFPKRESTSTMP